MVIRYLVKASKPSKTLVKAETLQKIGEKTISPYYAKLRDTLYGNKIGKMFASKHKLYIASKTDPEKVYQFVRKMELDRGLTSDKIMADRQVQKMFEELNILEPAEQKKIIEVMQDPSKWHRVTREVNFRETDEGKYYWNQLVEQRRATQRYLETLEKDKKGLSTQIKMYEDDIETANKIKLRIDDSHQKSLESLDLKRLNDTESLTKAIKLIDEQITTVKAKRISIDDEIDAISKTNSAKNNEIHGEINKHKVKVEKYVEEIKPYLQQLLKIEDKTTPEAILLQDEIQKLTQKIKDVKNIPMQVRLHQPIIDKFNSYDVNFRNFQQAMKNKTEYTLKDSDLLKDDFIGMINHSDYQFDYHLKFDASMDDIGKVVDYISKDNRYGENIIDYVKQKIY